MLGLLEGHRVVGHVHRGLGVAKEERRAVELEDAHVVEERAEEEYLLGGERGAEVLGLGARQRHGTLGFAKPMEGTSEEGKDGAAARESGGPTRINEGDKRARGGRMEVESTSLGAVEVDENADGGVEGLQGVTGRPESGRFLM